MSTRPSSPEATLDRYALDLAAETLGRAFRAEIARRGLPYKAHCLALVGPGGPRVWFFVDGPLSVAGPVPTTISDAFVGEVLDAVERCREEIGRAGGHSAVEPLVRDARALLATLDDAEGDDPEAEDDAPSTHAPVAGRPTTALRLIPPDAGRDPPTSA